MVNPAPGAFTYKVTVWFQAGETVFLMTLQNQMNKCRKRGNEDRVSVGKGGSEKKWAICEAAALSFSVFCTYAVLKFCLLKVLLMAQ